MNFLNCCGAAKLRGATSDAAPGAVPIGRRWGMALRVRHWSIFTPAVRPWDSLLRCCCRATSHCLRVRCTSSTPPARHSSPHFTSPPTRARVARGSAACCAAVRSLPPAHQPNTSHRTLRRIPRLGHTTISRPTVLPIAVRQSQHLDHCILFLGTRTVAYRTHACPPAAPLPHSLHPQIRNHGPATRTPGLIQVA